MADGAVEIILAMRDMLTGPAREAANAMAELAQREREEAAAAREAARVEGARERLATLAAQGSAADRAALQYSRLKAEIETLAKITGDQTAADKALAAAKANLEQVTARASTASAGAVGALDDMANATRRAELGAKQLRFQLADIGTQIVGGINPFVILAQQGPDLAYAFEAGGGAAQTMRAAFGGLASQAAAAAPILATVGVAVAALGTAAIVMANEFQAGEDAMTGVNRAILETGTYSDLTADQVKGMASALADLTAASEDARASLIELQAEQSGVLVSGARKVEEIRSSSTTAIRDAGLQLARLQRELQATQAAAFTGDMTGEESITRQRQLRAEIAAASAQLQGLKDARDQAVEDVNRLADAQERLRLADEAEREATKASTLAKKEHNKEVRDAAKAAAELEKKEEQNREAILEGIEAFYAMSSSARTLADDLRPIISQVDDIVPPAALERVDQLRLLLMQLNTEAARSPEHMAALQESINRVSAAITAEQAGVQAPQQRGGGAALGMVGAQALGGMAGAGSVLEALQVVPNVMQGVGSAGAAGLFGAGGAAAAAGVAAAAAPVAAVLAALTAAAKLIDAIVVTAEERQQGEIGLIEKLATAADDMLSQFAAFPAALLEQLSGLDFAEISGKIASSVEGFIVSFVEVMPDLLPIVFESIIRHQKLLANIVVGAIPDVLVAIIDVFADPQTWIDMAKAMIEAWRESWSDTRENYVDAGRGIRDLVSDRGIFTGQNRSPQVIVQGVVGDARDVVGAIRDRAGDFFSGLSLDRDPRWT